MSGFRGGAAAEIRQGGISAAGASVTAKWRNLRVMRPVSARAGCRWTIPRQPRLVDFPACRWKATRTFRARACRSSGRAWPPGGTRSLPIRRTHGGNARRGSSDHLEGPTRSLDRSESLRLPLGQAEPRAPEPPRLERRTRKGERRTIPNREAACRTMTSHHWTIPPASLPHTPRSPRSKQ